MWDSPYFFAWEGARNSLFWPRACLMLRDSHPITDVFLLWASLQKDQPSHGLKWMDGKCRVSSRLGAVSSYRGSCMTFPDLSPPPQRSKRWTTLWGHIAKGRRVHAKRKQRELLSGCWTHVSVSKSQFLCFALSLRVHFVLQPVLHFSLKPYPSRSSLSYIRAHQLSPSLNQAAVCLASRWGTLGEYHSGVIASL